MCTGIPGQVISISDAGAVVDFAGTRRTISLLMLPETSPLDWIVAHSGFAIKRITEEVAIRNLASIAEMNESGSTD